MSPISMRNELRIEHSDEVTAIKAVLGAHCRDACLSTLSFYIKPGRSVDEVARHLHRGCFRSRVPFCRKSKNVNEPGVDLLQADFER